MMNIGLFINLLKFVFLLNKTMYLNIVYLQHVLHGCRLFVFQLLLLQCTSFMIVEI